MGILEVTKKLVQLMASQINCFLRKKNLSPTVLLASLNEEMEINSNPMIARILVSNINGDSFLGFLTDLSDDFITKSKAVWGIDN